MPLLWRVFAGNAAVLTVATLILVLTPATVSFPVALEELLVLSGGMAVMLAIDVALLRRSLRPLAALAGFVRSVDPLDPGQRARLVSADPEVRDVAAAVDEMLDRLEAERRESARRAVAAQEEERMRIARELHDEVGQALTAVMWMVDDGPAREAVRAALEDVRAIARRLRPVALDDLGLLAALAALTTALQQSSGVRITRTLDRDAAAALGPDEELVVYRVAQEALTNVVRHADARHASVTLAQTERGVTLEIADDGRGYETAAARGRRRPARNARARAADRRAARRHRRAAGHHGPAGDRPMTGARVLIADDHVLVRHGLRRIIEAEPDFTVIAEAGDGAHAVEAVHAHPVDLAVLDVSMPVLTGLQAARRITTEAPHVRVLMLSMHDNEQYLFEALRAGASGYVLKTAADRDLIEACRAVLRGQPFLYPSGIAVLIRDFLDRARDGEELPGDALTPRELEVVKLVAEAYTSEQIAQHLGLSRKTVDRHRENVLAKLGMRDRVELTRYAIKRGLVEP